MVKNYETGLSVLHNIQSSFQFRVLHIMLYTMQNLLLCLYNTFFIDLASSAGGF